MHAADDPPQHHQLTQGIALELELELIQTQMTILTQGIALGN
jgi:hypothetical protein